MLNLPTRQLQPTKFLWPSQEHQRLAVDLKPKHSPSADDWERLRPIIKRLYVDNDLALVKVIKTMADEHGHKAS